MLPDDTSESALFESNELGENTGFGVFWAAKKEEQIESIFGRIFWDSMAGSAGHAVAVRGLLGPHGMAFGVWQW